MLRFLFFILRKCEATAGFYRGRYTQIALAAPWRVAKWKVGWATLQSLSARRNTAKAVGPPILSVAPVYNVQPFSQAPHVQAQVADPTTVAWWYQGRERWFQADEKFCRP